MRLTAHRARSVDNAARCPPPAPFAHLPTAIHHDQLEKWTPNTRPHYTQIFYNGSARFASPFPSLSRLIPELEKSALPARYPRFGFDDLFEGKLRTD